MSITFQALKLSLTTDGLILLQQPVSGFDTQEIAFHPLQADIICQAIMDIATSYKLQS